jgi:hypothetical protein
MVITFVLLLAALPLDCVIKKRSNWPYGKVIIQLANNMGNETAYLDLADDPLGIARVTEAVGDLFDGDLLACHCVGCRAHEAIRSTTHSN